MPSFLPLLQPYQWLKEKIMSEDGRKQQAKLKELAHIAEKLGCTLPQLAIGEDIQVHNKHSLIQCTSSKNSPKNSFLLAWCLRNEGVSSVLLGSSNPSQLTENLGAIQVPHT